MGVLLWQFDWRYVLVTLVTVAVYMAYTYYRDRVADRHPPPDERLRYRGEHQGDRLAAQLRDGEVFQSPRSARAQRYDKSMARYEKASVHTYTSLAVLNTGQAVIFTFGLYRRP